MKKLIVAFFSLALVCGATRLTVYAQDETIPQIETLTPSELTTEVSPETEGAGSKFYSRDRLTQTLLGTINAEESEGEPAGNPEESSGEIAANEGEPQAPEPGVAAQEPAGQPLPEGQGEPAVSVPTPEDRVTAFVAQLSDEQVFAMNRSLNNVVSNRLPVEYDMTLLEQIVENNYNGRQINALTKAIEEEAKFTAMYEKTGDEKFLAKAESQKEMFLGKTGRFGATEEPVTPDAGEADIPPIEAAISAALDLKNNAKQSTRGLAKDAARDVAKDTAKNAAKEAAKTYAKLAAKDAAKGAAKQAARSATQETRKENRGGGKKK